MWRQIVAVLVLMGALVTLAYLASTETDRQRAEREALNAGVVRIEGGIGALSTRLTGVETVTKEASEKTVASVTKLKEDLSTRLSGVEATTRAAKESSERTATSIATLHERVATQAERLSAEHGVLEQHSMDLKAQVATLAARAETILVALEKIQAANPALLEEIKGVQLQLQALQWGAINNKEDIRVLQAQIQSAQEWLEALLERADLYHATTMKGEN